MPTDILDKSRLQNLFVLKADRKGTRNSSIISEVELLLDTLVEYLSGLGNTNQKEVISRTSSYFTNRNYWNVFELAPAFERGSLRKESMAAIRPCLVSDDTVSRFRKREKLDVSEKSLDFFSLYLGYAGWNGFLKGVSLRDCFLIEEENPIFFAFDIDGYTEDSERDSFEPEGEATRKDDPYDWVIGAYNLIGVEETTADTPKEKLKFYVSNMTIRGENNAEVEYELKEGGGDTEPEPMSFVKEPGSDRMYRFALANSNVGRGTAFFLQGFLYKHDQVRDILTAVIISNGEPSGTGPSLPFAALMLFYKTSQEAPLVPPARSLGWEEAEEHLGEAYAHVLPFLEANGRPTVANPYTFISP